MLDQLGRLKFFSTLDLAAGYWQVQVRPDLREKTAFITHQGLYEFSVMPFGLKPNPECLHLLQFIELVSYYRRFIKGSARVAEPLHSLTRKDAIFE